MKNKIVTLIGSIVVMFIFLLWIPMAVEFDSPLASLIYIFFSFLPVVFISLSIHSIKNRKNYATKNISSNRNGVIEMINCPKCGKELNAANDHCPYCFTSLHPIFNKCPKCGFDNVEQAKFCKECGTKLESVRKVKELLGFPLDCPECNKPLTEKSNICEHCGKDIGTFIEEKIKEFDSSYGTPVDKSGIDMSIINATESQAIAYLVKQELEKTSSSKHLTLPKMEAKKFIATLIYVAICFIVISLYVFYHTYLALDILIILVSTLFYILLTSKYTFSKYIQTEVRKRPDTKISYIVSSSVSQAVPVNILHILLRLSLIGVLIVGCYFLYKEPHYIYEKQENGYALRYYTYGLFKQESEIVIPEEYNNMPVFGIRGDTFKNVRSIKTVTLPNTITEIRGGAFQGCSNLVSINLPPKITEIHGSTFEDCYSLEEIEIPEGVTRIGGSAFRNCSNLRSASIPQSVKEIGSSAFRNTSLRSVCISSGASVNERAFKGTYVSITYHENNCMTNNYTEDEYQYDY